MTDDVTLRGVSSSRFAIGPTFPRYRPAVSLRSGRCLVGFFQLLDAGIEPGGGARQLHFACPEDTVVVRVD